MNFLRCAPPLLGSLGGLVDPSLGKTVFTINKNK